MLPAGWSLFDCSRNTFCRRPPVLNPQWFRLVTFLTFTFANENWFDMPPVSRRMHSYLKLKSKGLWRESCGDTVLFRKGQGNVESHWWIPHPVTNYVSVLSSRIGERKTLSSRLGVPRSMNFFTVSCIMLWWGDEGNLQVESSPVNWLRSRALQRSAKPNFAYQWHQKLLGEAARFFSHSTLSVETFCSDLQANVLYLDSGNSFSPIRLQVFWAL